MRVLQDARDGLLGGGLLLHCTASLQAVLLLETRVGGLW